MNKLSQQVYDLIVLLRFAGVSLASNLRQFAVQANVRPVAVQFAPCWLEEVPLLQMHANAKATDILSLNLPSVLV